MLPRLPEITKCAACDRVYWLSEAETVSESVDQKAAPDVRELSEAELLQAADSGVARNRSEHMYLRLRAWWAANDRVLDRRGEDAASVWSPDVRNNLRLLFDLLSPDDVEERLFQAEIARETGQFEAAIALLRVDVPLRLKWAADVIRALAERRDPWVSLFP